MPDSLVNEWLPVASSTDLVFRHVFHGQLLGQDLALWRADDGFVNVWKNQCLHRGVRLSIGINDGAQLRCQYHGWVYANRTASCTYIPAHPIDAPTRTLRNQVFPVAEKHGLIWSTLGEPAQAPGIRGFADDEAFVLRPVPVHAPAEFVLQLLPEFLSGPIYGVKDEDANLEITKSGQMMLSFAQVSDPARSITAFAIQPVGLHQSVIRGVLSHFPESEQQIEIWRYYNQKLNQLRNVIESAFLEEQSSPSTDFISPIPVPPSVIRRVSEKEVGDAYLRVRVKNKSNTAKDILAIEMTPLEGNLSAVQPGAHIDVFLREGLVKQYSLVNGPTETDRYIIGVKYERDGKDGSRYIHETLRVGDELTISEPRSNFPLRRDATISILIAGGIGITPLMAMAKTLDHSRLDFALHYFCRSDSHVAFAPDVKKLGPKARIHKGFSVNKTMEKVSELFDDYRPGMHFYVCGPVSMLNAVKSTAKAKSIPDESVHVEYFENPNTIDLNGSFKVVLSRSNKVLEIPAGKSILRVLKENDVAISSSCEQGACGTCVVRLLAGEPVHQDIYLTETEKRQGKLIATCVSRSSSPELVLDL